MKQQRGIVLVLVLMITGILGLLMLQVSLNAREQVARAQRLSDRADARLLAQSREAALYYTLLTKPWFEGPLADTKKDNPYAATWNFRGEPFSVDGATYRMQDTAGLLPLPQPQDGTDDFVSLLRQLGVDPGRAERLGVQLVTLQGAGQNRALPGLQDRQVVNSGADMGARVFPVQSLTELRHLPDMDEELLARLGQFVTLYPTPGFNPLTAPAEVLAVKVRGSALDGLLELRKAGHLNEHSLGAVAGITADELTTTYPGPALRIELRVEHAGIAVQRETTVILRPYRNDPVGIWSRRLLDGAAT